jgi:hypothetical protein
MKFKDIFGLTYNFESKIDFINWYYSISYKIISYYFDQKTREEMFAIAESV